MNSRIKNLRKSMLNMTQEAFAKAINISRSNLASLETGRVCITDRIVKDICREFGVNEIWLRTGEGEPFATIDKGDRLFNNLGKLGRSDSDFVVNAVNYFAEASPEKLEIIEEFMKTCLGLE